MERSILGIKIDRVKSQKIKKKTKFKNAHTFCRQVKWRRVGHMLRVSKNNGLSQKKKSIHEKAKEIKQTNEKTGG